jgi:hypothetical protein
MKRSAMRGRTASREDARQRIPHGSETFAVQNVVVARRRSLPTQTLPSALCRAAVHGKDVFAVYQQNGAHGKEFCTVKLLTTHGKEGLHGEAIIRRTAKNKTTAKIRNAHGKEITRHRRALPCGSTSRTEKY